jgi:hypothetical protein
VPVFFRLIHLSDLHFGSGLDDPPLSSSIGGFGVHRFQAAVSLAAAVQELRRDVPTTRTVVTGDLTTWGQKSGFSLAFTYLRGQFFVGGTPAWLGLNDPTIPVIPGNHDAWDGAFPATRLLRPPSRAAIDNYFLPPAPDAEPRRAGIDFPFRVCLYPGKRGNTPSPAIYLYLLDSTRLDHAPDRAWRDTMAFGHVQHEQLVTLERHCKTEPDHPPGCIRIAAVHHPLAYLHHVREPDEEPPGPYQPGQARRLGWGLLNEREVISRLQHLGFSLALCGHLHQGFTRPAQADPARAVLHVLSAGTATQAIPRPPQYVPGSTPNQFQVYDFLISRNFGSRVTVILSAFEADFNRPEFKSGDGAFDMLATPGRIRLDLRKYPNV